MAQNIAAGDLQETTGAAALRQLADDVLQVDVS